MTVTLKMKRDLADWADGQAASRGGNRSSLIRSLLLKERSRCTASEARVAGTVQDARGIITLRGAQRLAQRKGRK